MGKVEFIKKARKERKCGRCFATIGVGTSYYKGVINFHPDIVRCPQCGLQRWEVTTSDYQLRAGEIVYKWEESYGITEGAVDAITGELEDLRDDTQDKLDNMPEQLQDAPTGEVLQERIEQLESCIEELENLDMDRIKADAMDDTFADDEDYSEDMEYDEVMNGDTIGEDVKEKLVKAFEEKLREAIDDALGDIGV